MTRTISREDRSSCRGAPPRWPGRTKASTGTVTGGLRTIFALQAAPDAETKSLGLISRDELLQAASATMGRLARAGNETVKSPDRHRSDALMNAAV